MFIYPLISAILFPLWRGFASNKSWIKKVESDRNWKCTAPIKGDVIWMHCASLGEFEMGRPVLEKFLHQHSSWNAVVTFFSPSGYEPRKNYSRAKVHYLPLDTKSEADAWLAYCRPKVVLIIRYDIWLNHLNALRKNRIPLVLVAMSVSSTPWYLSKWLPLIRKKVISTIHTWGVVNQKDASILNQTGIRASILGNPKYDYAAQLLNVAAPITYLNWKMAQTKPVLLVGSAHNQDIKFLSQLNYSAYSIWIVPHKPEDLQNQSVLFPRLQVLKESDLPQEADLLMITEFGILSSLYSLADAIIIGGGFGKATHNVLEATVQGKVVITGPHWQKVSENQSLIQHGYLRSSSSKQDWNDYLEDAYKGLLIDKGKEAQKWLLKQQGASEKILKKLEQAVQL
ncbi:MAG: glycosyltransferase N-terminal domain-containing protein [Bacteroidota bacterium]|nr:glycosyltransferase N-terminal domain-containing protein [Bacteroidota bacterium]